MFYVIYFYGNSLRSYQKFYSVCTFQYQPHLFTAHSTHRIGPLYRSTYLTNNIPIALDNYSNYSFHHSECFRPPSEEFIDF